MSDIKERLRDAVQKLRRTPMSISILAPLVQQAADHIATLEQESAANLQRALVAEKDASRYRFLRDPEHFYCGEAWVAVGTIGQGISRWNGEPLDSLLDERIRVEALLRPDTSTQEVG